MKKAQIGKRIFYLLFALKFLAIFFISNDSIQVFEDGVIAENLINEGEFYYPNDGTRNHSFQFPLYPYLVYGSLIIAGSWKAVIFLNILLYGLGSLLLVHFIRKLIYRNQLQIDLSLVWLLGSLVLIYPFTNTYIYTKIHPFALNFSLLIAALWSSEVFLSDKKKWWLLGTAFGLILFQRSSLFGVIAYPFLIQWINKEFQFKTWIPIIALASILPVSWASKNYQVDQVFGMTSTSGKILWKGTLLDSDGSNYLTNGENYYSKLKEEDITFLSKANVREQNEFFVKKFKENWRANPVAQLQHYFKKLYSFLTFRKNIGTEYMGKEMFLVIYKIGYWLLLIGFLCAVCVYPKVFTPMLIPFVLLALFQSFFYVEMRHRIIFEPLMISVFLLYGHSFLPKKKRVKKPA